MEEKLERLTEIIEQGLANINPAKKEGLSLLDEIAEEVL
jgi:hypothetical protein